MMPDIDNNTEIKYTFNREDVDYIMEDGYYKDMMFLAISSLTNCKEYFQITLDIDGYKRIITNKP